MKIHRDIEQGTDTWFALRSGRATASCFADVLAKGQGKTRSAYLRKVVAERLVGKPLDTYKNAHMERGQEQEPLARLAYEAATDYVLDRIAFIEHDTLLSGCSPDSLIYGKRLGVEIKCVIPTVQVETILAGGYPSEHRAQVQGSLWLTGYEEWDFVSYSPMMPAHLRSYIFTVQRDEEYIKTIDAEVRRFLAEVDTVIASLNGDLTDLLQKSLKVAA